MAREYVLAFRDQKGTDGQGWNTLRLGPAWGKRLVVDQVVDLHDGGYQVYAQATVKAVIVGPRDEIIREHSWHNHLMLGLSKEEAADRMMKTLPRLYGNLIFKRATVATVIYFDTIGNRLIS